MAKKHGLKFDGKVKAGSRPEPVESNVEDTHVLTDAEAKDLLLSGDFEFGEDGED